MRLKLNPQGLQDRLVDFGVTACGSLRDVPNDPVVAHIARQLVRSATSPAANYAEARGAESRRDFVHKMQLCLKELRETSVWLQFVEKLGGATVNIRTAAAECDELIAIFVRSVNTAKSSRRY